VEEAMGAEACVVDKHLEALALGRQRLDEVFARVRVRQVRGEWDAFHFVRHPNALRQVAQPIDASRDEHEVVAA
jgi:hypothetical protein